jgi:GTPase involved in cell partitioning and DNA repair
MKFPPLETMVNYGIYTIKELERYYKGLIPKKKIIILNECDTCSFVYGGDTCNNCHDLITRPKADSKLL